MCTRYYQYIFYIDVFERLYRDQKIKRIKEFMRDG